MVASSGIDLQFQAINQAANSDYEALPVSGNKRHG